MNKHNVYVCSTISNMWAIKIIPSSQLIVIPLCIFMKKKNKNPINNKTIFRRKKRICILLLSVGTSFYSLYEEEEEEKERKEKNPLYYIPRISLSSLLLDSRIYPFLQLGPKKKKLLKKSVLSRYKSLCGLESFIYILYRSSIILVDIRLRLQFDKVQILYVAIIPNEIS